MKSTTSSSKNSWQLPKISPKIYNNICISGNIPTLWKQATTISILKEQKDPINPTSYRHIALTSCTCKTLKRMINLRQTWFLESNNLLSNLQVGFRIKRSTMDQIVTLIHEAFIKKDCSPFRILKKSMTCHGYMAYSKIPKILANKADSLFS